MVNHKSAQKRSRQTIKKTKINHIVLSQLKTSYNKFISSLNDQNLDVSSESLRLFNVILSFKNS